MVLPKAMEKGTTGMGYTLPATPASLEATGLTPAFVLDLLLKHLYRHGALSGMALAQKLCLPFPAIEILLEETLEDAYCEKRGGDGLGHATDRFSLTERGRAYARDVLDIDTYTGPAPVPLVQYNHYIQQSMAQTISVTQTKLRQAWQTCILDDDLYEQLGPAICSGKSCFLYGPPGTGKTTIAKMIARYLDREGGATAIPHAVLVGGSVIRVFDPVYHVETKPEANQNTPRWLRNEAGDRRWVCCQRPAVVVGGELTLDMLDLRYNPTIRYYEAPLQMKANGGVFIIDDFGRQMVSAKDLLNRWIVPLEERHDYLTLHTGKKFSIPFQQFVVFATNLRPEELVDEAFLRRIRYKIFIGEPSEAAYLAIFNQECRQKNLLIQNGDLETLIKKHYRKNNRLLRACDPRDITDRIADDIAYNNNPREITLPQLDQHFSAYLADLKTARPA